MAVRFADGRSGITAALVKRLIANQFPQWRHLAITPVEVDGWDNRTFRLGQDMSVRLPTDSGYVAAVSKKAGLLPRLAPALPVAVPKVLGRGVPGEGYPYPRSVRGWLAGETADRGRIENLSTFAVSLAKFILALQHCDTDGAPPAGAHSWFRGSSLKNCDEEIRRCLAQLSGRVDTVAAAAVWEEARAMEWTSPPIWFHGDVAPGNLLVQNGRLAAVIEFGCTGIGDPACDLVIAWTMFSGASRSAFRQAVGQDFGTWGRARGWALWKALLNVSNGKDDSFGIKTSRSIIRDILIECESST